MGKKLFMGVMVLALVVRVRWGRTGSCVDRFKVCRFLLVLELTRTIMTCRFDFSVPPDQIISAQLTLNTGIGIGGADVIVNGELAGDCFV